MFARQMSSLFFVERTFDWDGGNSFGFSMLLMTLAFLLVATFPIINFSIFCSLYISIYEPDKFRQFFSLLAFNLQ